VRRFVVIGKSAVASDDFLLHDFAGTSGRLDVLARCVRAGLLTSHGVRHDACLYLVLLGGPRAPRTVRFTGAHVKYIRPDERNLAVQLKKVLAYSDDLHATGFVEVRAGIAVARGGLEPVLAEVGDLTPYVLEEGAPDIREAPSAGLANGVFFVGDHLGFDEASRARLAAIGARPLGVGPVSLHTEDVVTLLSNELDRREAGGPR
jgi:tRNA (pseudouridine54-N1)-methyltransferase